MILTPEGLTRTAYRHRMVGGTENLLAVTQIEREDHTVSITHVPTGCAFPGEFSDWDDAICAAVSLWSRFPREALRSFDRTDVERGAKSNQSVLDMMGVTL